MPHTRCIERASTVAALVRHHQPSPLPCPHHLPSTFQLCGAALSGLPVPRLRVQEEQGLVRRRLRNLHHQRHHGRAARLHGQFGCVLEFVCCRDNSITSIGSNGLWKLECVPSCAHARRKAPAGRHPAPARRVGPGPARKPTTAGHHAVGGRAERAAAAAAARRGATHRRWVQCRLRTPMPRHWTAGLL